MRRPYPPGHFAGFSRQPGPDYPGNRSDTFPYSFLCRTFQPNGAPNDTIVVDAIWYNREMMPYKEEAMVWVSKLSGRKLQRYMEEWTGWNAVYVTYPYARIAGATINDINTKLANVTSRKNENLYQNRKRAPQTVQRPPLTCRCTR